jgi:hypothetical protein
MSNNDNNENDDLKRQQQEIIDMTNQNQRHPGLPVAYRNLARIHDNLGNRDLAEQCRQRIRRLEDE